jgi:hypothetical protein
MVLLEAVTTGLGIALLMRSDDRLDVGRRGGTLRLLWSVEALIVVG